MIRDILNKSKEERKIINIWVYGEENNCWSGYVMDINDSIVQIQHYNKFGKPDGIIMENLDNIESLDFDDDNTRAMEYLINNHYQIDAGPEIKFDLDKMYNWQFEVLDNLVGKEGFLVKVQLLSDNHYSGIVKWISEGHIVLNVIGGEGQDLGNTVLKVDDIISIKINDMECRKKYLLYQWRKSESKAKA